MPNSPAPYPIATLTDSDLFAEVRDLIRRGYIVPTYDRDAPGGEVRYGLTLKGHAELTRAAGGNRGATGGRGEA